MPAVWFLPVVESIAINQGDALVGAFRAACDILERESTSVRVAEQHADFFAKNMVAILAERDVGLRVFLPGALCTLDLSTAPT